MSKNARMRVIALSVVAAALALSACGSDTERVAELENQVEELEGRLSSVSASSAPTTATTTMVSTTSARTDTTTLAQSWKVRFPGFEVLFNVEVSKEAEVWCRARPEEVLASFAGIFDANDFEEHWQLAMSMLEDFDYDVDAWRQDDKYDNGFWAWRSACRSTFDIAHAPPITLDPLLTIKISEAAALWCSTRPDAVLASFAELHEANSTGDISDYWTIAGMVLQQYDYDVAAWRQLDTFGVGFWAWRASCQVAYDSR
jgi:hypothetical protein